MTLIQQSVITELTALAKTEGVVVVALFYD